MLKPKLEIFSGLRIDRLTIGELVRHVQTHPLFIETPVSYLQQGRLREAVCDCGKVRLIAESILASGRLKSCGCLRKEIRQRTAQKKLNKTQRQGQRKIVAQQLKMEQAQLAVLKSASHRDDQAIEESGEKIRELIKLHATLARKPK